MKLKTIISLKLPFLFNSENSVIHSYLYNNYYIFNIGECKLHNTGDTTNNQITYNSIGPIHDTHIEPFLKRVIALLHVCKCNSWEPISFSQDERMCVDILFFASKITFRHVKYHQLIYI